MKLIMETDNHRVMQGTIRMAFGRMDVDITSPTGEVTSVEVWGATDRGIRYGHDDYIAWTDIETITVRPLL